MFHKAIAVLAIVGLMVFCLVGCGGSSSSSASAVSSNASSAASAASSTSAAKDFDGSKYSDTGAGEMVLRTRGGTTENGNVPQVAISNNTVSTQFDIQYSGGDGSVCTVYVDGVENTKMNASDRNQSMLTLQDSALDNGIHTVEMVAMDGDNVNIYKKAQYEIVK